MTYYTERHGMRKPIDKTNVISIQMYSLLFQCCEKYKDTLAWKYPLYCPDGYGVCGIDNEQFNNDLSFEIPNLFRIDGFPSVPVERRNVFQTGKKTDTYDQYSLLDYIEFIAQNCRDYDKGSFHNYFGHHHISFKESNNIFVEFQREINNIFDKTGLLYRLTNDKIIERIVENTPLNDAIEQNAEAVSEQGTQELLREAIQLYKQPYPESSRDAVEKIWDALERLKTYYTQFKKKDSVDRITEDMSNNQPDFKILFDEEFKALTKIGNNFRIRHHETDKIDITDVRHYDYFFNRCLSLIALAIQYLN